MSEWSQTLKWSQTKGPWLILMVLSSIINSVYCNLNVQQPGQETICLMPVNVLSHVCALCEQWELGVQMWVIPCSVGMCPERATAHSWFALCLVEQVCDVCSSDYGSFPSMPKDKVIGSKYVDVCLDCFASMSMTNCLCCFTWFTHCSVRVSQCTSVCMLCSDQSENKLHAVFECTAYNSMRSRPSLQVASTMVMLGGRFSVIHSMRVFWVIPSGCFCET